MKSKLTDDQIADAQKMRDTDKMSYHVIGEALGVDRETVRRALNPRIRARNRICSTAWHKAHKKEMRIYNAAYYKDHKEESHVYNVAYYKNHGEKLRISHAAYRGTHKKEAAAYHKEHGSEYAAWHAARCAKIRDATIGNLAEIKEIYQKAKGAPKVRCYLCGKLIPKGHRQVDHIIPLSKGGAHRPSNLAVACDKCNFKKHDKLPEKLGILL